MGELFQAPIFLRGFPEHLLGQIRSASATGLCGERPDGRRAQAGEPEGRPRGRCLTIRRKGRVTHASDQTPPLCWIPLGLVIDKVLLKKVAFGPSPPKFELRADVNDESSSSRGRNSPAASRAGTAARDRSPRRTDHVGRRTSLDKSAYTKGGITCPISMTRGEPNCVVRVVARCPSWTRRRRRVFDWEVGFDSVAGLLDGTEFLHVDPARQAVSRAGGAGRDRVATRGLGVAPERRVLPTRLPRLFTSGSNLAWEARCMGRRAIVRAGWPVPSSRSSGTSFADIRSTRKMRRRCSMSCAGDVLRSGQLATH